MVASAEGIGADPVIGSRYVPGGDPGGLGNPVRRTISGVANLLFRLSFDAGVGDATSGHRVYSRGPRGTSWSIRRATGGTPAMLG